MSSLLDIYKKDCRTSELASEMIATGFAFDLERAQLFKAQLRTAELAARARVEEACGRPLRTTATGGISTADLHQAVFRERRWPVLFRSGVTRNPSLGINAMRAYAAAADPAISNFALAELERRRARKLRSTYIEKVESILVEHADCYRVHPTFKIYGTVSGRWSSSAPNLQQLPRKTNDPTVVWGRDEKGNPKYLSGGIRSLYIARPNHVLISADCKQLELRIAAYISGDPYMLQACASTDMHSATAELVWGEAYTNGDDRLRYELRQIAKNFGFAVCYLAEAPTVYANIIQNGQQADYAVVEEAIRELRKRFRVYFKWQRARLMQITRDAYAYSPLWGRRRYLSHEPKPTEAANYHVQAAAADVVNTKLPELRSRLSARKIRAKIVVMVHDSCTAEVHEDDQEKYLATLHEVFAEPVEFDSSGQKLQAVFPIDVSKGKCWS